MKVLPVILEQNINTVVNKLDLLIQKPDFILNSTNQEVLSLGVYFVYPSFSTLYNIPTSISPVSMFSEAYGLLNNKLNLYINYLATVEDLKDAIPVGYKYDFVPNNWSIKLYVPFAVYNIFKETLGKVFKMGAIVFLSELNQGRIDELKQTGCKSFSLLGRHILHQQDVNKEESNNIVEIIKNNSDCEFILNTEIQYLIDSVSDLANVQICLDKSFWEDKL